MYDSARDPDNVVGEYAIPNAADAHGVTASIDFCAAGFKIRNAGAYINTNTHEYLFWAIAGQPFKYANAR